MGKKLTQPRISPDAKICGDIAKPHRSHFAHFNCLPVRVDLEVEAESRTGLLEVQMRIQRCRAKGGQYLWKLGRQG